MVLLSASVLYMNNWQWALKTRESSDLVSSYLGLPQPELDGEVGPIGIVSIRNMTHSANQNANWYRLAQGKLTFSEPSNE